MTAAVLPRVLLLGGLDPSGGAGITLDATVVALHGCQPLPVATVWTSQNRHGFRGCLPVARDAFAAALAAACDEGELRAIKIGLLATPAVARAVAAAVAPLAAMVPVLVDPVLSATAGGFGGTAELVAVYRDELLPLAALALPNAPELAALAAGDVARLLATGCRAVLQKGGHDDGLLACDRLHTARGEQRFVRPRLAVGPVRGTGCALASAIAARLACGEALATACERAGDWLAALLAALGPPAADGLPRPLPMVAAAALTRTSTR